MKMKPLKDQKKERQELGLITLTDMTRAVGAQNVEFWRLTTYGDLPAPSERMKGTRKRFYRVTQIDEMKKLYEQFKEGK